MALFTRSSENPILLPDKENEWESEATFNGSAIKSGAKTYLVYRAISRERTVDGKHLEISSIGHAVAADGIHFKNRRELIRPEFEWEKFGCEDPRITKMGGKFYIFYTALSTYPFSAEGIKVGIAITKDFKKIEKHSATTFNSKAMTLFPGKIKGKIAALLTVNSDKPPAKIALALFNKEKDMWSPKYWDHWLQSTDSNTIALQRSPQDHVEVGAPPIKTKYGWLLIYAYIKDYFTPARRVFGIEAALLDLKNPLEIIAQTSEPFLVPQEEYEEYGRVPKIVFPSGALFDKGKLFLYYGAADTTCCLAVAKEKIFFDELFSPQLKLVKLKRVENNPIITPDAKNPWEAKATFNPAALYDGKKVHILYRAMGEDNTSVLGYATSTDGTTIVSRSPAPAYIPREDFENKKQSGGNSGCEDPRLVKIGDTVYMCYTAFDGINPPRVALTSIAASDFFSEKWNWAKPKIISPSNIDDKDASLFPRKIDGKFFIIHRIGSSIWIDSVDNLEELGNNRWLGGKIILQPQPDSWDNKRIGLASPPIETPKGWLMLYHGIAEASNKYRVGAVILDRENPTKVIARTINPILRPDMNYERDGVVQNVVFPCGAVVIGTSLIVYYGGADRVTGAAYADINDLIESIPEIKK